VSVKTYPGIVFEISKITSPCLQESSCADSPLNPEVTTSLGSEKSCKEIEGN